MALKNTSPDLESKTLIIENKKIKITIFPKLGAKITSILYKPQNFEVLFQPKDKIYKIPNYGDQFDKYDTSGADEMFPNIDRGKYPFEEYFQEELPDHGELWSIPWKCKIEGKSIHCKVKSPKFHYIFDRKITLNENEIHFEYTVENIGGKTFRGLWAFHGLLAIDEESKLILNIKRVLNAQDSTFLGKKGSICEYPVHNNYRLDKFLPKESKNTEKFYLLQKPIKAAITLNRGKLLYLQKLDKIPFLGIWKNEGGFKGEYNCALEPSNGFYDSLEKAKETGKYLTIPPGQKLSWDFSILLCKNI